MILLLTIGVSTSTAPSGSAVSEPTEPTQGKVTIESWLDYFYDDVVQLETESQSSFVLGQAYGTCHDIDVAQKPARLRRGKYLLSPVLPFIFNEKDGEIIVELGDPDSFVDLLDLDAGNIYRLVSIGPSGFVLDVTWVSDDVIAVLCAVELEDSNRLYSIVVLEFDLESMVRSVRVPSDRKSFGEDAIYRFVIEQETGKKKRSQLIPSRSCE
jgi:hypothetical protein